VACIGWLALPQAGWICVVSCIVDGGLLYGVSAQGVLTRSVFVLASMTDGLDVCHCETGVHTVCHLAVF
jgi:hypothetical protein